MSEETQLAKIVYQLEKMNFGIEKLTKTMSHTLDKLNLVNMLDDLEYISRVKNGPPQIGSSGEFNTGEKTEDEKK